MNRAYSILEVKQLDDDQRVIEGLATSPTPDRVGDIVEPDGAEFSLPLPLLWQHDSRQPIGHVTRAKVSKDGISITARFVKIAEAGRLKDRLDEAWQSIKSGLVKGLSIGFRPTKDPEPLDPKDPWFGGLRFTDWEWLELSAVTIPANAEATIQTIKSLDRASLSAALRAKTADAGGSPPTPGAAGKTVYLRNKAMPTIRESIAAYEAKRAATLAAANKVAEASIAKGESMNEEDQKEFDGYQSEIEVIDGQIVRLKNLERLNAEKAVAVPANAGTDAEAAAKARAPALSGVRVTTKLEPGIRFARMAMCVVRAHMEKKGYTPEEYYRMNQRWMDTAPDVAIALKANEINAADTTTSGWASQIAYAQDIASEFIAYLRPMTIIGRIPGWRRVPFNIRVGSMTTGLTGYWVGQGQGIPMSQGVVGSATLGITKVAGVTAIDKELARVSNPDAEALVRGDLARACIQVADLSLIDPNQGGVANVQPASLTYGVTPVTPTGTNYAAFVADWKSLTSTALAANLSMAGAVLVMSEVTAQALSMMVTSLGNPQFPGLTMTGGMIQGLPVITSSQATIAGSPQFANIIVLIFPGEVLMADDGTVTVEASDQVSLEMKDATGSTIQSTATSAGASMVSMWQTESIAVKAVRYLNWTKARTQACAFIEAAAYA
jgi:HK97 family phage major capsid protein/HK97 family phage prohead protease